MFDLRAVSICLIFAQLTLPQDAACKKFDVNKFISDHATCNGETPTLPPEWVPNAVLAATKCLDVTDQYCAKLCLAYNYDGFIKDKKLDVKWLKREASKLQVSAANEKRKQSIVDAVNGCAAPNPTYDRPSASTESCPEWQKFDDCMDEAFQVACSGKKGKASFLDDD